jgi:hypothetical protein
MIIEHTSEKFIALILSSFLTDAGEFLWSHEFPKCDIRDTRDRV